MKLLLKRVHRVGSGLAVLCLVEAMGSLAGIAQVITPDGTLSNNSIVTPFSTCTPICTITGGTQRGTALFHSFSRFSVPTGGEAYFNTADPTRNIFARVTGFGNVSTIGGRIRTNAGVSLFLLNPNGISFGPNASLSIDGSFLATTATSFVFPDGSRFSAVSPQDAPLLTVALPIGLQYGPAPGFTTNPTIQNQGNLVVGQDLTFATQGLDSSATLLSPGSLTAGGDLTLDAGSVSCIDIAGSLTANGNLALSAGILDLRGQLRAGSNLNLLAQSSVTIQDTNTAPFQAVAGGSLTIRNGLGSGTIAISALSNPSSGFAAGGSLRLVSDRVIQGGAKYWSGGDFGVERLDGSPGSLQSSVTTTTTDPFLGIITTTTPTSAVVLSNGGVSLGSYAGASLHILSGGNITLGTATIQAAGTVSSTINPSNPNTSLASLASVPLPDGSSLTIDGSARPTLDLRSGIDWAARGGFPFPSYLTLPTGSPPVSITPSSTSANLTYGGDPKTAVPSGLALLSNRFSPTSAPGQLQVQGVQITAFSTTTSAGQTIVLDPRITPAPVSPPVLPVVPVVPIVPSPSPTQESAPTRSSRFTPIDGLTLRPLGTDPDNTILSSLTLNNTILNNLVLNNLALSSLGLGNSRDEEEVQISEGCGVGTREFIITGRGGLPDKASDPQLGGALAIPWVSSGGAARAGAIPNFVAPRAIVEAQGMAIDTRGEIVLTATANPIPHGPRSKFIACPHAQF